MSQDENRCASVEPDATANGSAGDVRSSPRGDATASIPEGMD